MRRTSAAFVSELLVAVQECHAAALEADHPAAAPLARACADIREGLGFKKSPEGWGAFPTDPYSHTPAHAGAQQPGMTGQVKEGILARMADLGVVISAGRIRFVPALLRPGEFATAPRSFSWFDANGEARDVSLPGRTLAFTVCGTLVVYALAEAGKPVATVRKADRSMETFPGAWLSPAVSAEIFARTGGVARIDVEVPHTLLDAAVADHGGLGP